MRKKESEANSSIRIAAEKARAETLERQARERAAFLAGDGLVIKRYNKEATKERREYLRKNRRQLEQARKTRAVKAASSKKLAQSAAKTAGTLPGRKKKTFIIGAAEKNKANEKWAATQARYILHRIRNRQGKEPSVQGNTTEVQESQSN